MDIIMTLCSSLTTSVADPDDLMSNALQPIKEKRKDREMSSVWIFSRFTGMKKKSTDVDTQMDNSNGLFVCG